MRKFGFKQNKANVTGYLLSNKVSRTGKFKPHRK